MKLPYFIGLIVLLLASCKKDPSGIPDVPVSFHASLDNQALQPLNTVNGSVELTGYGVAGIIIYRSPFEGLVAYDRCSSVNPENRCAVNVDDTGQTATDPCSKSVYSLLDGNPVKGEARFPLKRYTVSENGRMLSVTN